MFSPKRKYDAVLKVYNVGGSKLETQGSRGIALKAVYLMMPPAERAQVRNMLDEIDKGEKQNG